MLTNKLFFVAMASLVAVIPVSAGGIVVSVSGPDDLNGLGIFSTQIVAIPFTVGHPYTGVTIGADLVGSFAGTAYLTNQIGAGTTVANVISSAPFTAAGFTMLLQNLNLNTVGTYYLVLGTASNATPEGITGSMTSDAVITTDVGASTGPYSTSSGGCGGGSGIPCGFYPAYAYSLNNSFLTELHFTVSTPEPSMWILFGSAFAVLICWRRFQQSA